MNRGIDPATHRSINEPAQEITTISFGSGAHVKEEDQKVNVSGGFSSKDDEKMSAVKERCPDLNLELELRISPPHQQQPEPLKTGGRNNSLCFSCNLGIQNSKECSCSTNGTGSSNPGYDFLGLKTGILDYRSLEMKWMKLIWSSMRRFGY